MGFLSDALDFEKLNFKEMTGAIKDDPERLFLGALTPLGSEVWGGITGKDYESATNMWGGPSDATWEKAEEQGINTGPARVAHTVAETIAASKATQGLGSYGNYLGYANNIANASGMENISSRGDSGGGGIGGGIGGPPISDEEARRQRAELERAMNRGSSSVRISHPALGSINTGTMMATQTGQRPAEVEELMERYGVSSSPGAKTYPEGALPGPGLETVQSPALSPGLNGQASDAPAMAQPSGPRGGAGGVSAQDTVMKASPQTQIETAEQSVNAVSSGSGAFKQAGQGGASQVTAQKQQVNDSLRAQGVDPKEAFESLYKQELETLEQRRKDGEITKREHKGWKNRWKNIYNTIPEEDFGLFLMDFGLRMMAHSGQNDSLAGSIGTAGQGALQGALQRKGQRQQQGMEREQQAFNRAIARSGLEKKRDSQVESTQAGLIERGPDGGWRPITNPKTGKPYQRQYAGMDGYKGEKAWLYDFGKRIGKSEEEIFDIINGAMPEQQRRDRYEELVLKMIKDASFTDKDPVLGKKYRDFNAQDIEAWIQQMMGQRRGALQ